MNYLELTRETHRESASGGTAPLSLTGITGENLRLANWVKQADLIIQEMFVDWNFRWAQQTVNLVADTPIYSPASEVAEFDRSTFRVNGMPVNCVSYLSVKRDTREDVPGAPYQVVIMPDGTLRPDPTPSEDGELTFDYWIPPVSLSDGEDVSIIPERFHLAIVGKALMLYAEYEGAEEILRKGASMYGEWIDKLKSNQLPGDRYMHNVAEGNELTIIVE
ncbi:MAG: hypothetical protein KDE03_17670 [Rhodobacteraceae bacterium]|nr:hypothetical protein [Paracoccaceae bacterium]